jgi:hypothetical protein
MAPAKIYFGHPVNTYNTPLEKSLLTYLQESFPGCEIINPNSAEHDAGYKHYHQDRADGMAYFYAEVLPHCATGVFLPFGDGMWAAGCAGEANWFLAKRCDTIWRIDPDWRLVQMSNLPDHLILSVPATRERIYESATSRTSRPYA